MSRPAVIHILGPLRASGMERMLISAREEFGRQGVARSVVVGQGRAHPLAAELQRAGYEVELFADGILSEQRRFAALVRSVRPATIHIHTEGVYLATAVLSRLVGGRRVRIVRTVHSVFAARGWWGLKRRVQALVGDRFVNVVIAPSPDVAANERRYFRRPRVIFNWVDERYFSIDRSDTASRVGLLVGNCSSIKNHELALRSALESGWSISHLGDETDASQAELELLAQLDERGLLTARGVRDPAEQLASATMFMLPSTHEGMSISLAEALVCGLPALVADSPGLQWAAPTPGVTMLPLDPDAWTKRLRAWSPATKSRSMTAIDFSPARGVAEYLSVYGVAPGARAI